MPGQQLSIYVSTTAGRERILWAAVVLDNSFDPPVITGSAPVEVDPAELRSIVLRHVSRRYSASEVAHARWASERHVPALSHAAVSAALLSAVRRHGGVPTPTHPRPRSRLEALVSRDGPLCHWCRRPVVFGGKEDDRATVDHVVPRSRGGANAMDNLRVACYRCNHRRGNRLGPP